MQRFIDEYGIGFFPNIADLDGALWQRFGVTTQPAFAFVTADGSVDVVRGSLSEPALTTRVATLLASRLPGKRPPSRCPPARSLA